MASKAYVLKVKPQMDAQDAQKMERDLNSRYKNVAKNYGAEMQKQNKKTANDFEQKFTATANKIRTKYLAVAAATAGIVRAITSNPYEEASRKIDEYLQRVDNLATRAGQWGVDPAKFAIASEIAQVAGVDQSQFDNLLLRVADKLEAAQTGEDTYLKQFLGANDIIDATYQLVQTWRKMNPQERVSSMAQVVGNRQANAFAELVDTDWENLANTLLRGRSGEELRASITRGGELEYQQAVGRAQLRLDELYRGGRELTPESIGGQYEVELAKQREVWNEVRDFSRIWQSELAQINLKANTLTQIANGVNNIWRQLADRWGLNGEEGKIRNQERNKATQSAIQASLDEVGARNVFKYGIGASND